MARPARQQDAAIRTFRSPAAVYQALKSRPSQKFIKRTLAVSFDADVIPGDDKHAMYIRNLSGRDCETVAISNPAAGAQWTHTVPAGERHEIITARGVLTSDATAANREPHLIIDDGTAEHARCAFNYQQTASNAVAYTGFQNDQVGDLRQGVHTRLPTSLVLPAGWRIRSAVNNMQAGDTWTLIQLTIRRYVDLRMSTGAGDYTTNYWTLRGGEERYFTIHYAGLYPVQAPAGAYQQLFHCEWADELHIVNPSATSTCPIEVLVIG